MRLRPGAISTAGTEAAPAAPIGLIGGDRRAADAAGAEAAVAGLWSARARVRATSSYDRATVVEAVAASLARDADSLAAELAAESGYLTIRDMALEVRRAVEVFVHAGAVARVGLSETVNVDAVERARDAQAIVRPEPLGPVLGITAFNGPLLIAAHKIAPAIVAGAPIAIKPSPRVPEAAVALARRVVDAGWPADAIAVLPVDDETTMSLVRDERLPVVSFTGGDFGWTIKDAAPRKRVHLELGGVGAVVVAADADLEDAADQCAAAGFVRSGQACLAVQRIYVERPAYEAFAGALAERVGRLVTGPPTDPATQVGPLVDESAAIRVEAMIADARAKGARVLCGGSRRGALVEPTVVAGLEAAMALARREAFGPVVAVAEVASLAEAVDEVNAVDGAIHVGVFARSIDDALSVADRVRAGGVIVNGPTAWRVDHMPYGGTGTSGFGREGVRWMVAEYTEPKVVVIRRRPSTPCALD